MLAWKSWISRIYITVVLCAHKNLWFFVTLVAFLLTRTTNFICAQYWFGGKANFLFLSFAFFANWHVGFQPLFQLHSPCLADLLCRFSVVWNCHHTCHFFYRTTFFPRKDLVLCFVELARCSPCFFSWEFRVLLRQWDGTLCSPVWFS